MWVCQNNIANTYQLHSREHNELLCSVKVYIKCVRSAVNAEVHY